MAEITKLDMTDIWASGGDKVAPNAAKIAQGWIVEAVPRQTWNWFENRQDQNIAYILQKGIVEWDSTTEYRANKSFVQHGGIVYKCIQTNTNKIPGSEPTFWEIAFVRYTVAGSALSGVTPAADAVPYFTSTSAASTFQTTAYGRSLVNTADAAAARTLLSAQPLNTSLTALSGVTPGVNRLPYFDGVSSMTWTNLTAFGRALLDDADAAAGRMTLELNNVDNTSDANKPVSTATQTALNGKQNLNANLTALSGLTGTSGAVPYFTGAGAMANAPSTAYGRGLFNTANADSAQNYLGVTAVGKAVFNATNSALARAALELGTAATSDVTTSQSDTTVGRLTRTGDWGLGQQNAITMPDMTVAWNGGFYLVPPNAPGLPADIAASGAVFIAIRVNFGILIQTTTTTNRKMYHGSRAGTTGEVVWKEVMSVGDFGLGQSSSISVAPATLDLSTFVTGMYRCDVTGTAFRGLPVAAYTIYNSRMNSTTAAGQIAMSFTTGEVFFRTDQTKDFIKAVTADDFQANKYDSTSGKVLRTGAFGVGGGMEVLGSVAAGGGTNDCNSPTSTGFYAVNAAALNKPPQASAAQGYLLHWQHINPLYAQQEFIQLSIVPTKYTRQKYDGIWRAWYISQFDEPVNVIGDQEINGTKTLIGTQLRYKASTPGLWMEENGTATGIWMVLNGQTMQFQHRATGFGGTAGTSPLAFNLNTTITRSGYKFTPATDNNLDLGETSFRWKQLYAGTTTIATSDATEKTPVAKLTDNEIQAGKALSKEIGTYQWLDSVKEKGDEARHHVGMTVQRAIEVMKQYDLDPMAYGFICYDEWEAKEEEVSVIRLGRIVTPGTETAEEVVHKEGVPEDARSDVEGAIWEFTHEDRVVITPAVAAGSRYGFRHDQLNMFIAAGLEARISALEALL